MPTYGAIREQIRQALYEGEGERCSEEMLNYVCMLIHALATGQTDRLLKDLPSDAARKDLRKGLTLIQEEHAEAIRLVRAETERLFAEASRQGLTADAAEEMVQATLWREFIGRTIVRSARPCAGNWPASKIRPSRSVRRRYNAPVPCWPT